MDEALREVLQRLVAQDGVVHPRQLAAAGVSESRARRRVASGSWRVGPTGLYEVAGTPETFAMRCRRALVAVEHATRSQPRQRRCAVIGEAAARLLELPVITEPAVIRIGVAHAETHLDIPGVDVQRLRTWDRRGWQCVDGMLVSSVTDTILDVAAALPERDLLTVVQDSAYDRRTSLNALLSACRRGRTGSAAVRRVVPLLLGGVDSPAHHDFVRALRRAGFPPPECGVELVPGIGASDCVLWRPGATEAPFGLACETDGLAHEAPGQRSRDRRKDRTVADAGHASRRYSPQEIWRDGGQWVVHDVIKAWETHIGPLPAEWCVRRPRLRPQW